MTEAVFEVEASSTPAAIEVVNLGRPRVAIPVSLVAVLSGSLLLLIGGNIGRIPISTGAERDTSIVVNDLCVTALTTLVLLYGLSRSSLVINRVALSGLLF